MKEMNALVGLGLIQFCTNTPGFANAAVSVPPNRSLFAPFVVEEGWGWGVGGGDGEEKPWLPSTALLVVGWQTLDALA